MNIHVSAYGAVTSFGQNAQSSFRGLLRGISAFGRSSFLDLGSDYFVQKQIAEVGCVDTAELGCPFDAQSTAMTLLALDEAWAGAGLPKGGVERVGIALTTLESGALESLVQTSDDTRRSHALELADPEFTLRHVRDRVGGDGPTAVLSNACASGNHAVAAGMEMILAGEADVAVVGGGCKIFQSAMVGFHQFTGVSKDTCRPFDGNRSGTMLGDGAGILILESEAHARRRGHVPRVQVSGYGTSCDSFDMMAPHPEGLGMALAMQRALTMAGLPAPAIGYINAHGTGTWQNDRLETKAIHQVFGEHAKALMVGSTKSMLGHGLYAASALEAVWCCCVLDSGLVPPTANLSTPDPECDLDHVPGPSPRAVDIRHCMNNSFGFGGSNASTVFSRVAS